MKFGMLHLFESPMGRSEEQMLKEQVALMQAAEDLGFDSVNVLEASMAKAMAPAAAFETTQLGIELLGEVGARGDHLIEKLFRDVKAMDIVEGTGKVQRLVMARHLVNLPSERGS